MERLAENKTQVEPVSKKILEVLADKAGKDAVASLVKTWKELAPLEKVYAAYQKKHGGTTAVAKKNSAQQKLRATYYPFFTQLHACLKQIDKAVPEGWEVKPMGKVAKIVMGLSPKGNAYNETGVGMPLVNGPVEFAERFAKRIKWTTAPNKICKSGDLIVCVRGSTTGKFVKSDGEYCLGRGVCSISSKYQSFVDQMFKEQLPTLLV